MIGFWKMSVSGQYLTTVKGMSRDDIEFLHSLKEGDRMIIFVNHYKQKESYPDLSLGKAQNDRPL